MTFLSSKNIPRSLPSTSTSLPHLPLLSTSFSTPHQRSMTTLTRSRYLRLSPSSRTRLTNSFFILACSLSIITVSLGMGGVVGTSLPCPARRDGGNGSKVGLEEEREDVRLKRRFRKGKGKEVEGVEREERPATVLVEKNKSKRHWLEDPKPIQGRKSWSEMLKFPPTTTLSSAPLISSTSRKNQSISSSNNSDSNVSRTVEMA